jgi:MFS family permease
VALRLIATLGTAQTLAWGSTYYLPAILANAMAAELGISTATVFIAFSLGLLLTGFLGPASGRLIDLFGGRGVLCASNVIFAAGLALLGASGGAISMFIAWLVIGIGMSAGLYEAAFATLARIYGADARRSITGITLIAGFASTICWPLSAWMDASLGWRATCYVWAAAHLFLGLPLNLMIPAAQRRPHAAAAAAVPAKGGRLAVMAGLSFVFAAGWFGSTAMAAHLPRLLQEAGSSLPAAIFAAALVGPAQVAAPARIQPGAARPSAAIRASRDAGPPGRRRRARRLRCARRAVLHFRARRGEWRDDDRDGHAAARALRFRGLWVTAGTADGAGPHHAGELALRVRPAAIALRRSVAVGDLWTGAHLVRGAHAHSP